MDSSTPIPVSRSPIFVYTDLHLGVSAVTVTFKCGSVSSPAPASFPDRAEASGCRQEER